MVIAIVVAFVVVIHVQRFVSVYLSLVKIKYSVCVWKKKKRCRGLALLQSPPYPRPNAAIQTSHHDSTAVRAVKNAKVRMQRGVAEIFQQGREELL